MGSRRWRNRITTAISSRYQNATSSLSKKIKQGARKIRRNRKPDMDTTFHPRSYREIRDVKAKTDGSVETAKRKGNGGKDKRSRSGPTTTSETTIATESGSTNTKAQNETLSEAPKPNILAQIQRKGKDNDNDNDKENSNNTDNENTTRTRSSILSMTDSEIDTDTDTFKEAERDETIATSVVAKRRRVSFKVGFSETEIIEIEHDVDGIKDKLYYGDDDYDRFRASELKRYNKMVAKKLQKMVQEKIQPEINDAVANGATLEDIEAMVPQTHEEMVAYLGGEEKIRALVGVCFGSQLNGKDKSKETIRSSASPETTKTVPSIGEDAPTTDEDPDIAIAINPNEDPNSNTDNNPKSGSIRTSRSSIHIRKTRDGRKNSPKSHKNGGMSSVLEGAAEATAAAAENDTHTKQEDAKGMVSSELTPTAAAAATTAATTTATGTVLTLEEVDAMVPTTHAEMVAYLGAKQRSLKQLELSPKAPNTTWTIPSSPRLLEKLSMPIDDDDEDANNSGSTATVDSNIE